MAVDNALDSPHNDLFLFSDNMGTFDFAINDQFPLFIDPDVSHLFNYDQAQTSGKPAVIPGNWDDLEPSDTLVLPEPQHNKASGLGYLTMRDPTPKSCTTVSEERSKSSNELLVDSNKELRELGEAVSGTRARIKASEWTKKRALMKRLYMDEDRSLAVTRSILKEEHGFGAS